MIIFRYGRVNPGFLQNIGCARPRNIISRSGGTLDCRGTLCRGPPLPQIGQNGFIISKKTPYQQTFSNIWALKAPKIGSSKITQSLTRIVQVRHLPQTSGWCWCRIMRLGQKIGTHRPCQEINMCRLLCAKSNITMWKLVWGQALLKTIQKRRACFSSSLTRTDCGHPNCSKHVLVATIPVSHSTPSILQFTTLLGSSDWIVHQRHYFEITWLAQLWAGQAC